MRARCHGPLLTRCLLFHLNQHDPQSPAACRYNHTLVPGRTLVVGTEQGLQARVQALAGPVLRLRSTRDDGASLETELPLEARALAEVG